MSVNESYTHKQSKEWFILILEKKGYKVETEKKFTNMTTVIFDIYAEDLNKIIVIEIVTSYWSGKHPKFFINTNKPIYFVLLIDLKLRAFKAIVESLSSAYYPESSTKEELKLFNFGSLQETI